MKMPQVTPNWIRTATGAAGVVMLGAAALWFLGAFDSSSQRFLPVDDSDTVAAGRQIYSQTCASCHGDDLQGQSDWQTRDAEGYLPAPPHDETGHTWHHSEQLLFDITKYGLQQFAGADYQTRMPAYQDVLSDDEIIAVLTYIKAQWPEEIRARHDLISSEANRP